MELLNKTLLDYVAIIILCIVLIYSRTQFSRDVEANKRFNLLIWCLLLFSVFDVVGTITIEYASFVPVWLNYLVNSAYFLAEGASIIIFYKYVEKYTNSAITNTVAYYVLSYFPLLLAVECVIANCFVFILFEFDKYGLAAYGPLFPILYFILFYYYLLIVVMLVRNRRWISKRQLRAVASFICTAIVMMVVQILVLPDYSLQAFGFSVAALILMLTLETPDYEKLKSTLKSLEVAREQADKLENLKKFLMEEPDRPSAKTEYNFKKYIDDIYYSYRQRALGNRIDFVIETDDSIPDTVVGDKALLWQVVNDYLANIIENTKRGKVTLQSYAENVSGDSLDLVVSIICTNLALSLTKFELESNGAVLNIRKTEDGYDRLSFRMRHTYPLK